MGCCKSSPNTDFQGIYSISKSYIINWWISISLLAILASENINKRTSQTIILNIGNGEVHLKYTFLSSGKLKRRKGCYFWDNNDVISSISKVEWVSLMIWIHTFCIKVQSPQVTQRRKQERFTCCTKNPSFYFNVPPDDNNGPGGNLAPFETLSVMSWLWLPPPNILCYYITGVLLIVSLAVPNNPTRQHKG